MDIGTGIASAGGLLATAAVIIKLFAKPDKPEQCAVHGVVVQHLQEGIERISESVKNIEQQLLALLKEAGK